MMTTAHLTCTFVTPVGSPKLHQPCHPAKYSTWGHQPPLTPRRAEPPPALTCTLRLWGVTLGATRSRRGAGRRRRLNAASHAPSEPLAPRGTRRRPSARMRVATRAATSPSPPAMPALRDPLRALPGHGLPFAVDRAARQALFALRACLACGASRRRNMRLAARRSREVAPLRRAEMRSRFARFGLL